MKRVLFVDDEKNVLDGIRRMLYTSRDRWDLEFATSGEEALALCEERSFDIVVSDLRMPGMDGAELLGQIRKRYPATARMILSGYSEDALSAKRFSVAYRVLAKPCDAKDLKDALDRVGLLQDVLCTPALRKVIGELGELPTLSRTYEALSNALGVPFPDITVISRIVEQDVALSAKVLQLVNSGVFGLRSRVTSLTHAVNYLGLDTLRTLVLYSETFQAFAPGKGIPLQFYDDLQAHSQQTAHIAASFPLNRTSRELAVTASLLHDLGSLVLAATIPADLCVVFKHMAEQKITQAEAEEQIFGISHAEIGAYLLGLWGIDPTIVEAIAHHHHPERLNQHGLDCANAVFLADLLAHEMADHPEDTRGDKLSDRNKSHLRALGLEAVYVEYRAIAGVALQS